MTPITAPSPTTAVPDAIVALPGQAPVQQPATGLRPGGRDGPLRNGNPRGDPSLAPPPGQAPTVVPQVRINFRESGSIGLPAVESGTAIARAGRPQWSQRETKRARCRTYLHLSWIGGPDNFC